MKNNLRIKRMLIIQSFAPLFVLLTIKYSYLCTYITLLSKFICGIRQNVFFTLDKVFRHPLFGSFCIFLIGVFWLIITIFIALGFKGVQTSGFKSAGEKILISDTENEGSAIFLVTYILPLLTDQVDSLRELVVFILMLIMVIALLINSKNFYNNPILAALKYKIYSFKFVNPDSDIKDTDANYICITRDQVVSNGATIKRKYIADGVFLICNDQREGGI